MAAAERREAQVEAMDWIKDVLSVAANAGRGSIRFLERPLRGQRVERPDLRTLLAATALIMASVADDDAMDVVPDACSLVTKPRRDWRRGEWCAFGPCICGLNKG